MGVCSVNEDSMLKSASHQFLRYDELQTLLYETAAILNSRPLAPMETHDPKDRWLSHQCIFSMAGLLLSYPLIQRKLLFTFMAKAGDSCSIFIIPNGNVGKKSI